MVSVQLEMLKREEVSFRTVVWGIFLLEAAAELINMFIVIYERIFNIQP